MPPRRFKVIGALRVVYSWEVEAESEEEAVEKFQEYMKMAERDSLPMMHVVDIEDIMAGEVDD